MPTPTRPAPAHRVVIVGGGAGGLELAARLGRAHGPAHVTLVDEQPFHIWKPSLHEAAAGTLDIHQEGLSYLMLAHLCRFSFVLGRAQHVDPDNRTVGVQGVVDPAGHPIIPQRALPYDTLILAVGSVANFYDTPGAEQHAITLDTTDNAEQFRLTLLKAMIQVDQAKVHDPTARLNIVIVGGGATGVELAVELHEAGHVVSAYGLPSFQPDRDLSITVIEGAPRILAALPERLSRAAHARLAELGIKVQTGCRVAEVTAHSVRTEDGTVVDAHLCLWAAGIQGPEFLQELGLPINRIGQLEVNERLETPDARILAFGDCAAAPWPGHGIVPARAQAAHQQALYLARKIGSRIRQQPEPVAGYVYKDHGSLVSLGQGAGVGSLMGKLAGRGLFVSGTLARFMYMTLHLMHHRALVGVWRTVCLALGRVLLRRTRPRVKLH
jgi:NADH dehydrogenase